MELGRVREADQVSDRQIRPPPARQTAANPAAALIRLGPVSASPNR